MCMLHLRVNPSIQFTIGDTSNNSSVSPFLESCTSLPNRAPLQALSHSYSQDANSYRRPSLYRERIFLALDDTQDTTPSAASPTDTRSASHPPARDMLSNQHLCLRECCD